MTSHEFDELAGRIEGTTRCLMHLCVLLESSGLLDGPRLECALQSQQPRPDTQLRKTAACTMSEIAQALASARSTRQEWIG